MTSATGDLIVDNTNATGSTIVRLGTDTAATDFQVQGDGGTARLTVTGAGTVTAPVLTDGTATLTGGNLSGLGTITATTLTDGTATLTGGNLSGAGTVTAATFSGSGSGLTNTPGSMHLPFTRRNTPGGAGITVISHMCVGWGNANQYPQGFRCFLAGTMKRWQLSIDEGYDNWLNTGSGTISMRLWVNSVLVWTSAEFTAADFTHSTSIDGHDWGYMNTQQTLNVSLAAGSRLEMAISATNLTPDAVLEIRCEFYIELTN